MKKDNKAELETGAKKHISAVLGIKENAVSDDDIPESFKEAMRDVEAGRVEDGGLVVED